MLLKWLSFILVPLLAISLLPRVTPATVLWQDNFDEYYNDMPLEESPDWEKIWEEPDDDWFTFWVLAENNSDLWVGANLAYYRASGGASDPEMKVSSAEVYLGDYIDASTLGIVTRLGSDDETGYIAYYCSGGGVYYTAGIIAKLLAGSYVLSNIELPGPISSISIIALGQNPVHIVAQFDDYSSVVDDYTYNFTGGYGGIYASCCM